MKASVTIELDIELYTLTGLEEYVRAAIENYVLDTGFNGDLYTWESPQVKRFTIVDKFEENQGDCE